MALSSHQTYYDLLGITQQANVKEIRDAYHRLALKCHPDKDPCNPRAVAAFQNLSAAYETLSNEHYRRKYDAILSSSQRAKQSPQPAWPPQTSSDPSVATRMWQEKMRSRAWDWTSRAQERANQARREDNEYWSGPTYFHGATDSNGRGEQRNPMQKDRYSSEHYERQREARNEARKGAERNKSDTRTSPPEYLFDQGTGEFKAGADNHKEQQEAWEKAERDRREDDGYRGKPPSPQYPDPDWSDKVQKEYQERLKRAKEERSSHRKAERKQSEKEWPAELLLLLSKIISIQADIEKTGAMVGKSKRAMKDERKDEDQEYIFELAIKRKSLERRLKECLDEYKRTAKLMRDRGREQEANEADVKLREARKTAARDERTARKETEQASSRTETHTKGKSKSDQAQPSTKNEGSLSDQRLTTPQAARPYGGKCTETEQPPRMTLPMYDGQNDERPPSEYMAIPRVSYDGSDPDRGFTEETPEPSVAGEDNEYDDEDYDPPFCNDFHDSHLEVHRGFWDIIDSEHECNFCHKVCTVMRCPSCDVQACTYCKDRYG